MANKAAEEADYIAIRKVGMALNGMTPERCLTTLVNNLGMVLYTGYKTRALSKEKVSSMLHVEFPNMINQLFSIYEKNGWMAHLVPNSGN